MSKEITLVLATEADAEKIHDMKCKAFLPLVRKMWLCKSGRREND